MPRIAAFSTVDHVFGDASGILVFVTQAEAANAHGFGDFLLSTVVITITIMLVR